MTYRVKIHTYESEKLVAICDSELIGSEIHHNGVALKILPRFYGDIEMSAEEVLLELKASTSYNVIGKKICNLLIKHGFLHPKTVIWMEHGSEQVGHAIVVR